MLSSFGLSQVSLATGGDPRRKDGGSTRDAGAGLECLMGKVHRTEDRVDWLCAHCDCDPSLHMSKIPRSEGSNMIE